MSKRPIEDKKRARVVKQITIGLPVYINLIEYVKDRTRCTTGTARQVLLAGSLMVDSHPVGFKWEKINGRNEKILDPLLPAENRNRIVVTSPDA